MEMKNYKKDCRKLKQQKFAQPLLSLNSSSLLKPQAANIQSNDYENMERGLLKNIYRYPHRVQQIAAPEHTMQEQAITVVRHITVDLRPVLREAVDLCEEESSDAEKRPKSPAVCLDQGLHREFDSHLISQRPSVHDLQSENSSVSTSELLEQGWNRRYFSLENEGRIQSNPGTISFSLPSLQNNEGCEKKWKPSQKSQRRISLLEINKRLLSFEKDKQLRVTPPVSFPKIILKELSSQKSKEQRLLPNENPAWLGLENLQLPVSDLVKVIKEQTSSEQHTLIAKVLCSLREKQEKDTLHHVRVPGRMNKESPQKIPQIPCGGGEIRLTWIKRS
ncbi:uncharacterized protein [Engystomops pustulosus]|uniref:uncharacterized protein n=1 Tax=Engystomops pustulosus TaxID=76066 RepID=UPI003AFAF9B5